MRGAFLLALGLVGAGVGAALAGPGVATAPTAIDATRPPGSLADPALPALLREPSPERAVFERHCLTCHGLPIIAGQRLTPAQWQAEVVKMREKFAAPLVPLGEDEGKIAELLARAFPPELPPAEVVRITAPTGPLSEPGHPALVAAPPGGDPERGAVSYAFACSSCHGKDGRGGALGPRLVLRPALADERSFQRVIAGGQRSMLPLPGVSEADAIDILAYLRALGRSTAPDGA